MSFNRITLPDGYSRDNNMYSVIISQDYQFLLYIYFHKDFKFHENPPIEYLNDEAIYNLDLVICEKIKITDIFYVYNNKDLLKQLIKSTNIIYREGDYCYHDIDECDSQSELDYIIDSENTNEFKYTQNSRVRNMNFYKMYDIYDLATMILNNIK